MKFLKNIYILSFILLVQFAAFTVSAQVNTSDEKAMEILDNAIGELVVSENFAIYYDGIAAGVKTPEDIFTLPVYEVSRGGHLFVDKDKFEVKAGFMNSICDGKLMVLIQEQNKTMFIDSVNIAADTLADPLSDPQFDELMKEYFTEGVIKYQGIITINNHKCHKIRSEIKNNSGNTHVIYWVDVNSGNLYLMAEYDGNNAYTVYWINKVTKAPLKYNYTIFLPPKHLTTFHGYKVIDNRFNNLK